MSFCHMARNIMTKQEKDKGLASETDKVKKGCHQKNKKQQFFGHFPNMGGGQQRSQTFYQKKLWTCFKGRGGSKGLIQSSFLEKNLFWRSLKSFSVLKLSTFYMLLQYHIPTQGISE